MIKKFYLMLMILALFRAGARAQMIIDTMYFDNDWEQCAEPEASYYRIISASDSGAFLLHVADFYLSGQVQMNGSYRSIRPDNKIGVFTYYYENGQVQAREEYDNNTLDGPYEEWYKDGTRKSSQILVDGKLNGNARTWNEEGIAELDVQYNMGKLHGYFISYYSDGTMARKDLYDNDVLVEGKCFDHSGNKIDYFPYIIEPSYSGGVKALQKFIKKELKYPSRAYKNGIEGVVEISFTVDEQGRCINPTIISGERKDFNEEAIRLVSSFPRWIPGKIDDQNAPIEVRIPIEFTVK